MAAERSVGLLPIGEPPSGITPPPPLPTLMQVGKTHKLKLSGVNYYKYLMLNLKSVNKEVLHCTKCIPAVDENVLLQPC